MGTALNLWPRASALEEVTQSFNKALVPPHVLLLMIPFRMRYHTLCRIVLTDAVVRRRVLVTSQLFTPVPVRLRVRLIQAVVSRLLGGLRNLNNSMECSGLGSRHVFLLGFGVLAFWRPGILAFSRFGVFGIYTYLFRSGKDVESRVVMVTPNTPTVPYEGLWNRSALGVLRSASMSILGVSFHCIYSQAVCYELGVYI